MMKRLAFLLMFLVASPAWAVGPVPFDIINLTTGIRIGGAAASGKYLRGDGTNFVSGDLNVGDAAAGTLAVARGGTNLTASADDNVMLGNGTTWQTKAVPDCTTDATQGLGYDAATNAFECHTISGGSAPFADTTSIVEGSADATKEIRFEIDGLTTGTVRVLTPPDANIVLAGSASALTSGRIPVVTTSGLLTDTANLTFDATNFRLRGQNLTTATNNATNMVQLSGTLPTVPSTQVVGALFDITSAGSAAQNQVGMIVNLNAGYTGSALTRANQTQNATAGTGNNLNLAGASGFTTGNIGTITVATGSTAGANVGNEGAASNSTAINVGSYGKAASAVAGTNIGILGSAGNSTEATDLKNVAGAFSLHTALPTVNVSVALLAQNTGTEDIFRGYDDTTLMFRMEDTGEFTSAGTSSIGWSVQSAANQACNTTCTNACVVGQDSGTSNIFVGCADATADVCMCAGSA